MGKQGPKQVLASFRISLIDLNASRITVTLREYIEAVFERAGGVWIIPVDNAAFSAHSTENKQEREQTNRTTVTIALANWERAQLLGFQDAAIENVFFFGWAVFFAGSILLFNSVLYKLVRIKAGLEFCKPSTNFLRRSFNLLFLQPWCSSWGREITLTSRVAFLSKVPLTAKSTLVHCLYI